MDTIQLDLSKRYTFADYLTWVDNKRREIIDGFVKLMSPAPVDIHQRILGNLYGNVWNFLRKNKCEVRQAPYDVRLPDSNDQNEQIYTVVQPDLCIICDTSKIDKRVCLGAPDFIIEVLSEGDSKHDVETKFQLYEKHGVREYWIVHPMEQTVTVFVLNESGKYQMNGMYAENSQVKVNIFDDFYIDLAEVFDDKSKIV